MNAHSFTDPAILEGSYWPRVEACYSQTWTRYDMPPHFHNRAEVMYVLKGWCLVHLFDYRTNPYNQDIQITGARIERMGPGDFMFLDQGLLHELEVPDSSYMLNAEFRLAEDDGALVTLKKLAEASPALASLVKSAAPMQRGRDESGLVVRALEQVITQFSGALPREQALSDVLMAEMLLRIAENLRMRAVKSAALTYAQGAADYINAHQSEDIRVDDVARSVGVAPAYLQRVFKQAMGMTMIEYANRLRVEQSKRLLMYTDDPVVDVAIACGFNSRQHFFRVFNALTGVSPQQFRQEHSARSAQPVFLFDNVEDHSYDRSGVRNH